MSGIKLMMLGGGVGQEDPGSVTYSAGTSGAIYEPSGWDTVDLEIAANCGQTNKQNGAGYSPTGKGTMITKDDVAPADVTIYVADGRTVPGASPGGTGGNAGVTNHTFSDGGYGGAASVADVDGTASVAAGGGGDSGGGTINVARQGRPENYGYHYCYDPSWIPTTPDGGNGGGAAYSGYYGGGGGGGGGVLGGAGCYPNIGGDPGGGQIGTPNTDGSINYTTVTHGDNAGAAYIKVSWG